VLEVERFEEVDDRALRDEAFVGVAVEGDAGSGDPVAPRRVEEVGSEVVAGRGIAAVPRREDDRGELDFTSSFTAADGAKGEATFEVEDLVDAKDAVDVAMK